MSNNGYKIKSVGVLEFGVRKWKFLNAPFPVAGSKKKRKEEVLWTKKISRDEGMDF